MNISSRNQLIFLLLLAISLLSLIALPAKRIQTADQEFKKILEKEPKTALVSSLIPYSHSGWSIRRKANNLVQYNPLTQKSIILESNEFKKLSPYLNSVSNLVEQSEGFEFKKLILNQSQAYEYFISSNGFILSRKVALLNEANSKLEIKIGLGEIGKLTYQHEKIDYIKSLDLSEPLTALKTGKNWKISLNENSDFNKVTDTVIVAQAKLDRKGKINIIPRSLILEFRPNDYSLSFNISTSSKLQAAAILPTSTPTPLPTPNYIPTKAPDILRQKFCKVGWCRYMTELDYLNLKRRHWSPTRGWDLKGLNNYLTPENGWFACNNDRDCFAYRCTGTPQACNKVAIENIIKSERTFPPVDNCFVDESQGFKPGGICFYTYCQTDASGNKTGYCVGKTGKGTNACSVTNKNMTVKDPVCMPPEVSSSSSSSASAL